jgi:hypothetical protein
VRKHEIELWMEFVKFSALLIIRLGYVLIFFVGRVLSTESEKM